MLLTTNTTYLTTKSRESFFLNFEIIKALIDGEGRVKTQSVRVLYAEIDLFTFFWERDRERQRERDLATQWL